MTQPSSYPGRPQTPAPGVAAPELRLARLREHAGLLTWSAGVLVVAAGATGYFSGVVPPFVTDAGAPLDALAGTAFGDVTFWALVVWAAALVIVVLLVLVPYLRWLGHTYTITTRRVVEQSGFLRRDRRELTHARGYTVAERRGPMQRLWGSGTLVLSNGVDAPLVLRNVPSVRLVHETLADQVEISQILAHRDSHAIPTLPGTA